MARVLVIGYGNPVRADDGVGPYIAQALQKERPDCRFLTPHQLTPELAEDVARSDLVLFIDAEWEGTPGEVKSYEVKPAPTREAASFTHQMGPQLLVTTAELLYGRAPRAFVVSVTGGDFGFTNSFSPEVERAIPELTQRALEIIDRATTE